MSTIPWQELLNNQLFTKSCQVRDGHHLHCAGLGAG